MAAAAGAAENEEIAMRAVTFAACPFLRLFAAMALGALLVGQPAQAQVSNERIGNVLGGVAGGLLGSQIGGGSGRIVGAAAGAVGGVILGGAVGRSIDEKNAAKTQPAPATRAPQPVYTSPSGQTLTALRNANVRSGPSTDTAIVGRLPQGSTVRRLGEAANGGWLLVDIDGRRTGYVYAPLLGPAADDYAG
jgi:uncharacterized protein YgiM (DUF1202 family)